MMDILKTWAKKALGSLKKNWAVILLLVFWELPKKLAEDRMVSDTNRFIDSHAANIAGLVKPVFAWLVQTPFLLLTGVLCFILLHAYFLQTPKAGLKPEETPIPSQARVLQVQEAPTVIPVEF